MYSVDEQPASGRHPLAKGASPEAIAAALLPEDRTEFLAEYEQALGAARESLDLTDLFRMLEHWRRVAALQADPEVFRRVARRAAELLTGEPSPVDEPLELTRQKAGGI
jgi:DNA-binding IclR family transcriptional regulator